MHQLDDLALPTSGVVFDLLSGGPVITGHADGVVTIDLAEGDDGHREALRVQLAEPCRTLLGHLCHETGHWYWTVLVEPDPGPFRTLFGDERADHTATLDRHYAGDPAPGWESSHATAHPWEDWAESFAHYLHIRDTLQTAAAFGLTVADLRGLLDEHRAVGKSDGVMVVRGPAVQAALYYRPSGAGDDRQADEGDPE